MVHPFDNPQNVPWDYAGPIASPGYADPNLFVGPDQRRNFEDYHHEGAQREQQAWDIARRAQQGGGGGGTYARATLSPAEIERARRSSEAAAAAMERAAAAHRARIKSISARYGNDAGRRAKLSKNQSWLIKNRNKHTMNSTGGLFWGGLIWGGIFIGVGFAVGKSGAGLLIRCVGFFFVLVGIWALALTGYSTAKCTRLERRNDYLATTIGCGDSRCSACRQ